MEEKFEMYSDLRGLIRAKYKTQANFAHALGIGESAVNAKLNGRTDFTRTEIEKSCVLLGIPFSKAGNYFFNQNTAFSQ